MKNQGQKIAENLRRLLFEQDITPTELARQINIPQQTIQRIVKNKIKKPHAKTINAIAAFFKIDVAELTGEKQDLFATDAFAATPSLVVPVYEWPQLEHVIQDKEVEPVSRLFALPTYSDKTYGVLMNDSSMSPYFMKEAILIIEPNHKPCDRAFVLVYLHVSKQILFRQLLSDGENFFLKALSADLANFPVRKLDDNDIIMGVLVETRQTQFQTFALAEI